MITQNYRKDRQFFIKQDESKAIQEPKPALLRILVPTGK